MITTYKWYKRWLMSAGVFLIWSLNHAQASTPLELTESEVNWIKEHQDVVFTGDPNWLPYEAFTKEGEYIGIVSEHLKLISEATGLRFKMSPSKTWTESTLKAKNGQVDILSETDDSDLKSHLNFTTPYLSNPIVIAMRINENYVESVSKIADKRIALIKDYGYASKIRRKYENINFITVDNIQDGLISVSTGKVDALFCTLALCSYTIHDLGINDVKITGKTEFDTKLALGVQKNNPELLSILNKAIANIPQGQQQKILDDWVKYDYVEKTDYTPAYIVAAVSLILISIFIYANRRLSKEIALRNEVEKQLIASHANNERYKILFYESKIGHSLNRLATGEFVSVNQCFAEIIGYTLEELKHLSYWDLTPEIYAKDEAKQLRILKEKGSYGPYEKHYIKKSGEWIAVRLNGSLVNDPINGEKLILSVVEDISAYAEAKENLRLSALVLENSSEAMFVSDKNNRIITTNPAFTHITGYSSEEAKGKNPAHFKSGKHSKQFYDDMWKSIRESGRWQGEVWDKRKNGEIYAKWLTIDTIKDKNNNIYRHVALFSDITERKLTEETIWKQANFDSLTNLPNRNMFNQRLKEELVKAEEENNRLALLLIDLDHFKEVNDTLGHDMGDRLLKLAADRITRCVRHSDIVARLGGDEFTIAITEFQELKDVEQVARKLINTLAQPYELLDEVIHASASVGITLFPNDATSIESLIKNADQAMYAAKNEGRNRYSYFTQSLQEAAQNRLRLSNDLRKALEQKQFLVYFQPVVDLNTHKIIKAEALIRWSHPERGFVPPLDFIPIAESIGLINEIGDWVYKEANSWWQHWRKNLGCDIHISINMSPIQFKESKDEFGKEWLSEYATINRNQNLIVEITEGLLLNSDPEVLDNLYQLRDAGIEVAIDDFGTGYSSLSYLKKFDIDYLKIDKSFIRNIETDPNDLALSQAIIVMAHKLGLKVIAEGVETHAQENILSNAGCDFAQGYLYSKPVPPREFEVLLSRNRDDCCIQLGTHSSRP